MSSAADSAALFAGERVYQTSLYPMLAHHRPGSASHPLLVFVPGGGHLARIGYGHPGSREEDFLVPWLNRAGFEVLAISYPSDHPAISAQSQAMTITQWARCIAEVAAQVIGETRPSRERDIVLIGWSMAGRLARTFPVEARQFELRTQCFIGLAATAPFLNLTPAPGITDPVTATNLWDSATRAAQWDVELTRQERLNGRVVIPRDIYQRHYRCNNPLLLRAAPRESVPLPWSVTDIVSDLGTFEYEEYPLCAAVVPTAALDARHVLTDRATWSFINSQMIYCDLRRHAGGRLDDLNAEQWYEIRQRVAALPEQLFRDVEGGHFFFLGEKGARESASHIEALIEESARFLRWRDALFPR